MRMFLVPVTDTYIVRGGALVCLTITHKYVNDFNLMDVVDAPRFRNFSLCITYSCFVNNQGLDFGAKIGSASSCLVFDSFN